MKSMITIVNEQQMAFDRFHKINDQLYNVQKAFGEKVFTVIKNNIKDDDFDQRFRCLMKDYIGSIESICEINKP